MAEFLVKRGIGENSPPSSLRNLKLLLYLNLRVVLGEPVHVQNVLKDTLELRYLSLLVSLDDKTELELGGLVNLESLWSFSTQHSSETDLLSMTKLRFLSLSLTGRCNFENILSALSELRNLEALHLLVSSKISADFVEEFVLNLYHLKEILLAMHMPRFSDQVRFPPHLAHIRLLSCSMEEDPMPILEKLLHLKSVQLTSSAYVGRRMVCSKGGFPQLSALVLSEESDLEEWIVEEGSSKKLQQIVKSYREFMMDILKGNKDRRNEEGVEGETGTRW